MSKKLPKRLRHDTLVQAIFEVRFRSSQSLAGDLLVGMLMDRLGDEYPTVTRLPAADIPDAVLRGDSNLTYTPIQRLVGEKKSISVGHRIAAVSVIEPYKGWDTFKEIINGFLEALQATKLVSEVERFSLKYVNLIPMGSDVNRLNALRINVRANEFDYVERGFQLRMETDRDGHVVILVVHLGARVAPKPGVQIDERAGVLVDVDVLNTEEANNIWTDREALLEAIHQIEKSVYFGVLTPETIESLGPEW